MIGAKSVSWKEAKLIDLIIISVMIIPFILASILKSIMTRRKK